MSSSVILLFGGQSSERRVSVASAQYMAQVLPEAMGWFWDPDGRVSEVSRAALIAHENPFKNDFKPTKTGGYVSLAEAVAQEGLTEAPRVVIMGLHGGSGENGEAQSIFEAHRVPFTASGAEASATAFKKDAAKKLMREAGIRVAPALLVPAGDVKKGRVVLDEMVARYERVVLKPNADGSSHGLFIVENEVQKENALFWVQSHPSMSCLVEAFVRGREMTTGVISLNGERRALPSSEVVMEVGRVFDYEGKYLGEGSTEITPAEISTELAHRLGALACEAHDILGCFGYSRTDFLVDESGPVFIETNTLPGLTSASFIPQQLEAAGISMLSFLRGQIEEAQSRYTE
jgi:D-alanine-D-alanine ligase